MLTQCQERQRTTSLANCYACDASQESAAECIWRKWTAHLHEGLDDERQDLVAHCQCDQPQAHTRCHGHVPHRVVQVLPLL